MDVPECDDPFAPGFVTVPRLEPDSVYRLREVVHVPYWTEADQVEVWNIARPSVEDAEELLRRFREALAGATLQPTKDATAHWIQSAADIQPGSDLKEEA